MEEVDHTEEECTICKQGYTMEVVDYTDTECVTTYRDSCSWGGDPNRVWSRDVKSYFAITFWQQRTYYYRRYVLNSEMDGSCIYICYAKGDLNCQDHLLISSVSKDRPSHPWSGRRM